MKSSKYRPIVLKQPYPVTDWYPEPELTFGGGGKHVDPKVGIPLYGPSSFKTARHKGEVHVGFIGDADNVDRAMKFYEKCANGVNGHAEHPPLSRLPCRPRVPLDAPNGRCAR